jgi:hypothetical protein
MQIPLAEQIAKEWFNATLLPSGTPRAEMEARMTLGKLAA